MLFCCVRKVIINHFSFTTDSNVSIPCYYHLHKDMKLRFHMIFIRKEREKIETVILYLCFNISVYVSFIFANLSFPGKVMKEIESIPLEKNIYM